LPKRRRVPESGLSAPPAPLAKEKALPFEPQVPNEGTIEATEAARHGELVAVGPPDKLLKSLDADC
jgi:antitoxin component of RelBE/YafQ-DinJ toxin-antitoxin module